MPRHIHNPSYTVADPRLFHTTVLSTLTHTPPTCINLTLSHPTIPSARNTLQQAAAKDALFDECISHVRQHETPRYGELLNYLVCFKNEPTAWGVTSVPGWRMDPIIGQRMGGSLCACYLGRCNRFVQLALWVFCRGGSLLMFKHVAYSIQCVGFRLRGLNWSLVVGPAETGAKCILYLWLNDFEIIFTLVGGALLCWLWVCLTTCVAVG
jgi:hypothetical protein